MHSHTGVCGCAQPHTRNVRCIREGRARSPANLVQAQRDFFGSHTYERTDMEGWYHTLWSDMNSADSITTSGYKA